MKNLSFLLLLVLNIACNQHEKRSKKITANPTGIQNNTILPGDQDSVVIDSEHHYKKTKAELRKILKDNPELDTSEIFMSPDIYYFRQRNMNEYGSEKGQDIYYATYAYFLKLKHPGEKHKVQRQNLVRIYRDINFIFDRLAGGGTYFGHQYTRILGEAEYDIYRAKDNSYFIKTYNISKQKSLYLKSLKQVISDEIGSDLEISDKEKLSLKKELFKNVQEIDSLITNYFYLESTRTFQYSNY
ncbi:hypothetical protein [Mucilaginibacter ginsenosidivorax]|uniref:Uncharacterized protein n=1 Tax=Mucilaginibacter ginsenosidivorax TaxID=862126 RepID=A0A5B8W6N7_9SPHI|nr:hypothetical protein [Mucilaginibacter ginsenosidivorax]QEC79371.1 hypothetical protein FSB76_26740 [Mucilaginibacter ginsenosidivorax]